MKTILIIAIIILFYGIVLSVISKVLGMIIYPFNMLLVAWKERKTKSFIKSINGYFFQDGLETDIFHHYNLRTFWNYTLSNGGIKFGFKTENHDEQLVTLSARIGEKYIEKSLSIVGLGLYYFLYIVDISKYKKTRALYRCL
jgi:hypothetical protein